MPRVMKYRNLSLNYLNGICQNIAYMSTHFIFRCLLYSIDAGF